MPWTKVFIENNEQGFCDPKGQGDRIITYSAACHEALDQALALDKSVFIMGQGVDDPSGMFGTTLDLHKKYGKQRVFDTPLSENGLTGVCLGASLMGMRPVYVHNRPDFLLLAMDQLVNHAAKWRYMFGGQHQVPMVIRAVIGRGWGSGAQHSQSLHGLFSHVPGLKVVMPATAYDVKGLLLASIADNNPIIFLEHRWLYKHTAAVPQDMYRLALGKGVVRRSGNTVTVVAISYMVVEALRAAQELISEKIDLEIIDPRTIKPLDEQIIIESVKKTGRLVVADTDWKFCGMSAEIAAIVAQNAQKYLKAPIMRVAWPDTPVPSGYNLEQKFYPGSADIVKACRQIVNQG